LAANSVGNKTWLAEHSGENQDCQHILEKNNNWQHILWEDMIGSTFW
jgi:hypothetical protein